MSIFPNEQPSWNATSVAMVQVVGIGHRDAGVLALGLGRGAFEMRPSIDFLGTAALLRSGYRVSMAGHVGAVLAALGTPGPARLVALAAWGYLVYLQVRVSLDAELFTVLANGATPVDLDAFLVRAGLVKQARERTDEDRCRGALRLWRWLMGVLVIELVAAVIGLR